MEHFDLAAFYGGSATELYRTLGAHRTPDGWVFRVWAPHAGSVSVVGDFCAWDPTAHPMRRLDGGIWETEVAGLSEYDTYKFAVTAQSGAVTFKADPYAFHAETRPGTASKLYELAGYDWGDGAYLAAKQPVYDRPLNIYEVHLGSWRRRENGDFYDYRTLARELADHVLDLGYNCVELMPVTEYSPRCTASPRTVPARSCVRTRAFRAPSSITAPAMQSSSASSTRRWKTVRTITSMCATPK